MSYEQEKEAKKWNEKNSKNSSNNNNNVEMYTRRQHRRSINAKRIFNMKKKLYICANEHKDLFLQRSRVEYCVHSHVIKIKTKFIDLAQQCHNRINASSIFSFFSIFYVLMCACARARCSLCVLCCSSISVPLSMESSSPKSARGTWWRRRKRTHTRFSVFYSYPNNRPGNETSETMFIFYYFNVKNDINKLRELSSNLNAFFYCYLVWYYTMDTCAFWWWLMFGSPFFLLLLILILLSR